MSLLSLVYFIICSFDDELSLYASISSSYATLTATMGNVIFVFVRWSQHFASFYTAQLAPNLTSYATASFPILHLLPIDSSSSASVNDLAMLYTQQLNVTGSSATLSDDVRRLRIIVLLARLLSFQLIFILSELESVLLLQQTLASNLSSTNWSTSLGPVTLDGKQQRSFLYAFIGRQCDGTWAILKSINPTFTNIDASLCTYFNYPNIDTLVSEDSGQLISSLD